MILLTLFTYSVSLFFQPEEPAPDPAFDAVLRSALTSCSLAMANSSVTRPTADALASASNLGPSNAHHSQRPSPYPPRAASQPTRADDAMDDDMGGFEVESVAPSELSARSALWAESMTDFDHPQLSFQLLLLDLHKLSHTPSHPFRLLQLPPKSKQTYQSSQTLETRCCKPAGWILAVSLIPHRKSTDVSAKRVRCSRRSE